MKNHNFKIGIVGAGFSGASMALHLYHLSKRPVQISLIETKPEFAKGVAYSTPFDFHLLNVPAGKMSAFEDQPDSFVQWLRTLSPNEIKSSTELPLENYFVSRKLFGLYLQNLLDACRLPSKYKTIIVKKNNCVNNLKIKTNQLELTYQHGLTECFDKVILALGNQPPKPFFTKQLEAKYLNNPWDWDGYKQLNKQNDLLIIGTGLTMIDTVLTLENGNFAGKIFAVSRHGLAPHVHALNVKSTVFFFDLNMSPTPRELLNKVRKILKSNPDLNWRSVIDSLRPITQRIWQDWPLQEKERFLRHVKAYWEIHRHRIAPEIADKIKALKKRGKLLVLAGKVNKADFSREKGIQVEIQPRGKSTPKINLDVEGIINCTGPECNYNRINTPLITSMRNSGFLQADKLQLGLEVDDNFALVDKNGRSSKKLFAIGPLCKGKLWEITAVPDIRKQTKQLAEYLLNIE